MKDFSQIIPKYMVTGGTPSATEDTWPIITREQFIEHIAGLVTENPDLAYAGSIVTGLFTADLREDLLRDTLYALSCADKLLRTIAISVFNLAYRRHIENVVNYKAEHSQAMKLLDDMFHPSGYCLADCYCHELQPGGQCGVCQGRERYAALSLTRRVSQAQEGKETLPEVRQASLPPK